MPLINSPGHMDAILDAAGSVTGTACSYNGSGTTIDITNSTATDSTKAFLQKYITYFAGKGCKYFNMGADEYANDVYSYGSMGFGNAEGEVLSLYRALQGKARILVMGGSNEKLKTTLRREFGDTITVLDYTREVPLYMDAADVLITKPGGLSTTESAVCRIPTVLTAPIPGWEEENVAFFVSHGLARFAVEPEEIALEVCRLLEDPSAREGMMLCQRREIGTSAAENIMDYVEKREMTAREAGEEE